MRNLILSPHLLYLVNTQRVQYSGAFECPKIQIYPERKNVAVMEVSNHFFELEKIKGHGLLLGREIPIRESSKEFIDITTFQKFSFERDFDFEHADLRSLRESYRKYQIVEQEDVSMFRIKNLYYGKVCMYQNKKRGHSRDLMENIREEMVQSLSEIDALFIQFENGSFMHLSDFIDGKYLQGDFMSRVCPLGFNPIEEIPLEELKSLSILYYKKKKCLQFPKSNI